MLTGENRQAIEADEELRHAVRQRLEAAKPAPPAPAAAHGFGKKLFDFFNSTLGMWLLSSVVLTGGAALLQNIQHQHEIEQKNRELLATNKFEVTHRLDQMEVGLRRAKTVGEAKAAMEEMFKSKYPMTPELQNRSLGSLYLTMYQILSGSEQQKSEKAIDFIGQLEKAEDLLQAQPDAKALDAAEKEKLHSLVKATKALHFSLR